MPGKDYGPGGKWIHDRAHGIMEDGKTPKHVAYAIATQQAHKVGKSPKDFRTPHGVHEAKKKYDEPKSEYQKTAGIEEAAPVVGGLAMGVPMGRAIAGHTAAGIAPRGRKTRSEDIARRLGWIGAPAGAIAGLALAKKYGLSDRLGQALASKFPSGLIANPDTEQAILRGALPLAVGMGGGALGGLLTGAGVGGVQRLRGSPYKREQEKEAMYRGLFDELEKIALELPGHLMGQAQAALQASGGMPTQEFFDLGRRAHEARQALMPGVAKRVAAHKELLRRVARKAPTGVFGGLFGKK